jgi:hypothetical protein
VQDRPSWERTGWRERSAHLRRDPGERTRADAVDADECAELVFAVDYRVCRRCRLGWVEHPWTAPRYRCCGLAAAALAALRAEHPGLAWHTLGGHQSGSRPFWTAAGAGVEGGYEQRPLCRHAPAR